MLVQALADPPDDRGGGRLLRALRDDAPDPYVLAGHAAPVEAPGAGGATDYALAREDGDPDGPGGAIVLAAFVVPEGDEAGFLEAWDDALAGRRTARGFLGARLLRAGPHALEWIRWSSPLMLARALGTPRHGETVFVDEEGLSGP